LAAIGTARRQAFPAIAENGEVLVAAIREYRESRGHFPVNLQAIVSERGEVIIQTGAGCHPEFSYTLWPDGVRWPVQMQITGPIPFHSHKLSYRSDGEYDNPHSAIYVVGRYGEFVHVSDNAE